MARILVVGVLAIAAVLVATAFIVALAPYIAAVAVIILVVLWYERDMGPPPPSDNRSIQVIDPE